MFQLNCNNSKQQIYYIKMDFDEIMHVIMHLKFVTFQ